jgi:precorrin-8X/cobalt-precorrin-8 methylmutase
MRGDVLPHEIERESFRIVLDEMDAHDFSAGELAVAVRVIHATADFDFQDTLRFHPQAVEAGVAALRRGSTVVTDVRMVEVGVSSRRLTALGGRTVCDIAHPEVREQAAALGVTRSTLAMRRNAEAIDGGIVAVGNAPTALLEVIRLVQEEDVRPALVVGVPVGFVNAVESKDVLLALDADVPTITAVGRKGGSTVAASIVNALLRLAEADDDGSHA